MATEAQELEALFVRIFAKTDQFFQPMEAVRKEVGRVVASFEALNKGSASAAAALTGLAGAASGVSAAMREINVAAGAVNVQGLVSNLSALASSNLTNSLSQLARGLKAIGDAEIAQVAPKLRELSAALQQSKLGLKGVANASENLSKLSDAFRGFIALNTGAIATKASNIGDSLVTLNTVLTADKFVLGLKSVSNAATNLRNLADSFLYFAKLDSTRLVGVSTEMSAAVTRITDALFTTNARTGKQQALLAGKATQDSISNLANLAAGVGMFRLSKDRMQALQDFTTWLPKMTEALVGATGKKVLLGTASAQQALTNLGGLATSLSGLAGTDMTAIASNMRALTRAMQPLSMLNVGNISSVLTALGTSLPQLAAGMASLKGSGLLGTVSVGNASNNLTTLATALQGFTNINPAALAGASAAIGQALPAISQGLQAAKGSGLLGTVSIGSLAKNLTALAQATTALSAANPQAIINNARAMRVWLATLSGAVNPAQMKNLKDIAKTLNSFTSFNAAFANIQSKLPIQQNFNNTLNYTDQKARAAAGGVARLSGNMSDLSRSAIGARTSLTLTQLSMAAFVGFGIVHFARFDELMARTLARMGEFSEAARERLGRGVLDLSTHTTTDAGHLASALGTLSAAGMNQPMAMQALPIVETHAAATGIEAARAARQLTTVLNSLGMTTGDVTRDMQGLVRISNVFVRTGQMVDSTVEELSEAFSARYAGAVRQVGWSLEQGMSLIAAYADAGVRGADAGNRASVLLQSLEHALIGNLHAWEALGLGVDDFTRIMQRGPGAVIHELERRLAHLGPVQQRALLERMGFESRVTQALYPLLGLSHAADQVGNSLTNVNGVAERTANIIRNSFGGQIKMLWNTLKAMAIDIGDTMAPAIGYIGEKIRVLAQWFRSLSAPMQRLIVWTALIVSALGLIGSVGTIFAGAWTGAVAILTAAGGALVAIIGWIATIGAFLAPVLVVLAAAGAITLDMNDLWERITGSIGRAGRALFGFAFNLSENMQILSDWFSTENETNFQNLGNILATLVYNLQVNFGRFFTWFSENWRNLIADAGLVLNRLSLGFVAGMLHIIDAIKRLWDAFWRTHAGASVEEGLRQVVAAIGASLNPRGQAVRAHVNNAMSTALGTLSPGGTLTDPENLGRLESWRLRAIMHHTGEINRSATFDTYPALRDIMRNAPLGQRPSAGEIRTQALLVREVARAVLSEREAMQGLPQRIGEAIQQPLQNMPGFQTAPFPQMSPLFQPHPGQIAGRAAALLGMGMAPGGPLGMLAGGAGGPFLNFPQFNLDTSGAFRPSAQNRSALAAMAVFGHAGPLGMNLSSLAGQTASMQQFLPAWARLNAPHRPDSDFGAVTVPGGRSPGTSFASLSQQRFVIGGPATARIEQSVRDTEGDRHLQNISTVLQQNLPGMARTLAEALRPSARRDEATPRPVAGGTAP